MTRTQLDNCHERRIDRVVGDGMIHVGVSTRRDYPQEHFTVSMTARSTPPPIVITGVGLVSPLGESAWSTFAALLNGKTLSDRARHLPHDVDPVDLVRYLGNVSCVQQNHSDPVIDLAERAGREATFMAGVDPRQVRSIVGASKGAVTAVMAAMEQHGQNHQFAREPQKAHDLKHPVVTDAPLAITLGPHGYLMYHLARRIGCVIGSHVVTACASSLTALHQARLTLTNSTSSQPSKLLVLTAEASLLPLFIHSYRRLGILAPLRTDLYRGLSLDRDRRGFMLAQLAAAVVLERVEHVEPGQIELVDTAIATESHDLIRTNPTMPALSHVAHQLLADSPIDLLHPHATGTIHHDAAELAVLSRHVAQPTDVYACKGALGHGLGASGLVSLVLAYLCAKAKRRPRMPWLEHPMDAGQPNVSFTGDSQHSSYRSHAIFASGFGGHVAGAVIRRHD